MRRILPLLLLAACEKAPETTTPATAYLTPETRLDPTHLLPPPPAAGPAATADAHAFDTAPTTGPGWDEATRLTGVRTPAFQQALSCALGITLSDTRTPALRRLLARTSEDMRTLTDPALCRSVG